MNHIKEIRKEIEPFACRDAELSEFEGKVGYKVILNIVGRDRRNHAINLETGERCDPSEVWEIVSQARLSKKRYHYLKRKGREQQLADELAAEIALAVQHVAERVGEVREVARGFGIHVLPVPQEVQNGESSDAVQ